MNAGERYTQVVFERGTATEDDYGGETLVWAPIAYAFAKVTYGNSAERRQAAQEQAEQAATIYTLWTPALAGVTAKDRATFNGSVWDLDGLPEPLGLNKELRFTAKRSE